MARIFTIISTPYEVLDFYGKLFGFSKEERQQRIGRNSRYGWPQSQPTASA